MTLSLREKQVFYSQLSRLLKAGVTLPVALQKLASTAGGATRKCVVRLASALDSGASIPEAFAQLRPAIGAMEQQAISALERTGRMDEGLHQLAEHFGALNQARSEILRRSAYPVFILHFGVLIMNVPVLFTGGGVPEYLRRTGFLLFCFYAVVLIVWLAVPLVRDLAVGSAFFDRLLGWVPVLGKMRRAFCLARFTSIYGMQLNAGVNVIDALLAAGRASRSGRIRDAVQSALPRLREGEQVGGLLAASGAFPEQFVSEFMVAEETGELDEALLRWGAEYRQEALQRLQTVSDWVPKLIYLGIVLFLGWSVISGYQNYVEGMMRQIDSL